MDPSSVEQDGSASAQEVTPDPYRVEGSWRPYFGFFRDVWQVHVHPVVFFRAQIGSRRVVYPLVFALLCSWAGALGSWFWRVVFENLLGRYLRNLFEFVQDYSSQEDSHSIALLMDAKARFLHWVWGAGPVLLDPFFTLSSVLFTSFLVFVGARLLITPGRKGAVEEVRFESALQVVCFGMAPAVLSVVPLLGTPVSKFLILVLTIVGAREIWRIQFGRALVIAVFPKLLLLAIILFGVTMLVVGILKLVSLSFL